MVGLKDLGEAAWSVEQLLNLWLRQEHEVTPAILELLGQACAVFVAWVAYLKAGHGQAPDAVGLIALAEALRRGSESVVDLPLATEQAAAQASAADDSTRIAETETKTEGDSSETFVRLSIAPALAEIFNEEAGGHLATLQSGLLILDADPVCTDPPGLRRRITVPQS